MTNTDIIEIVTPEISECFSKKLEQYLKYTVEVNLVHITDVLYIASPINKNYLKVILKGQSFLINIEVNNDTIDSLFQKFLEGLAIQYIKTLLK